MAKRKGSGRGGCGRGRAPRTAKKATNIVEEIDSFVRNNELKDGTFEARIVLPRYVGIRVVYENLSLERSLLSLRAVGERGNLSGEKRVYCQGHYESEDMSFADRKVLPRNVEKGQVYAKLMKG
jgi:hypothetical protein